ncbi:MAG: ParB/RepB/Spo0J family partition protein [Pseudomonadota bacterium]
MDDMSGGNARKRGGLGRGLNALFGDSEAADVASQAVDDHVPGSLRKMIGVHQIAPGSFQPRTQFDKAALQELAQSLRTHGLLQPILVRPRPDAPDQFEIVAGERRWRAAQIAQLHEVPVIIKPLDDQTTLEIALIENLQRQDLTAIEEAQALGRLAWEFGYTQERIAEMVGKSRSYVANTLRLLDLPQPVQDMVLHGALTAGHARAIATSPDPFALASQVVAANLSVRATEDIARTAKGNKVKATRGRVTKGHGKDVNTVALEQEVSAALGLHVTIDMRSAASGKMAIEFKTLEQLDDVLHRVMSHGGRRE